ncbi:MAG: sigma-70 family RNA polymerase sigma factor [Opitutaceae bacterium]|jgi:RNA polymerase sigma-70 factor (ECF subfamily)
MDQKRIEDFSVLVRTYQAGLRAYVRALGVDEVWVDDIAQEAFLVAYRRYDDFDPTADFGKWLRGIARLLVANELRKKARHTRLLNASLTDMLLAHEEANATGVSDTSAIISTMQNCVSQLPPHSQDLLHRRYSLGENATQLAERLRMSAEAVRQTLVRVRVIVKRCIEQKREASLL